MLIGVLYANGWPSACAKYKRRLYIDGKSKHCVKNNCAEHVGLIAFEGLPFGPSVKSTPALTAGVM
jgi:hypothetical protein